MITVSFIESCSMCQAKIGPEITDRLKRIQPQIKYRLLSDNKQGAIDVDK